MHTAKKRKYCSRNNKTNYFRTSHNNDNNKIRTYSENTLDFSFFLIIFRTCSFIYKKQCQKEEKKSKEQFASNQRNSRVDVCDRSNSIQVYDRRLRKSHSIQTNFKLSHTKILMIAPCRKLLIRCEFPKLSSQVFTPLPVKNKLIVWSMEKFLPFNANKSILIYVYGRIICDTTF